MNKLIVFLAVALALLSGCMPTSRAQELEEDRGAPEAAIARSAIARLESKDQVSEHLASKEPVRIASADTEQSAQETDDSNAAPDESVQPTEIPPDLWIDISMGAELVEWFNETAYSVDVARADHVSMIDLLENIQVGRRLVVFKSVADAEQLLPRLADKMDIIGYNLEFGSARPDEREDPVGSVRRMRELADEYGKELAFGPDRGFALNYGPALAPYVDMFVLQVQRAQTEPDVVLDFVVPLAAQLRAANPEIEISVQVRTEGDPAAIADLIKLMESSLDGVSILTNAESTDIAEDLVADLRPPRTVEPSPESPTPQPSPTRSEVNAAALPTATATPRRTVAATPAPMTTTAPASTEEQSNDEGGWLLVGTLAALGVLVASLLTTAAVYAVQRVRR